MQSSFNIIKEHRAFDGEKKKISTSYQKGISKDDKGNIYSEKGVTLEEAKSYLDGYEQMASTILQDANTRSKRLLEESVIKAQLTEKEAYDLGYEQGLKNGFEDGRKEALEKAKEETDKMIDEATNVLLKAEKDYNDYLESKKTDILNLVLEISSKVLYREVSENSNISEMVEEAIELSKDEENIIIKCNPVHSEELKKHIDIWKPSYNISKEIFILDIKDMKIGNAIIEKNSGKVKVGIEEGLEKIKNVLFIG